ncbi:MAG TPA: SRPBCC family protein [Ferruginibacter sp.]|nr:SRPBCC family protein [Ferruginibacter sp.]
MPIIELETKIKSEIEICFDLSRSIDLHKLSTAKTNELAIAGRTQGLINLDEIVTWEATHFGIKQKLTSKISAYNRPFYFRDVQIKGAFKYIIHDHIFSFENDNVIMKDIFEFKTPFGFIGKMFDKIVLTKYLTKFLIIRNGIIKDYAETGKWRSLLNDGKYL